MTTTDIVSSSTSALPALFRRLESETPVPFASQESITPFRAAIRAMHVDLGELKAKIGAHEPRLVTIYADTVTLPPGLTWRVGGGVLMIIARRIEAGSDSAIGVDFRRGGESRLIVFAGEIAGSLNALAMPAGNPTTFTITAPLASGGVEIALQDGVPVRRDLPRTAAAPVSAESEAHRAIHTQFLFASLLYDSDPPLAQSMLQWVRDWAVALNDDGLMMRSTSLLLTLMSREQARQKGAAFVPYLSRGLYTGLAAAFARDARQYEQDYRTIGLQRVLTRQSVETARRLARQQLHQSDYVEQLVQQARANYDNAVAAVEAADANLRAAKLGAELVRVDFEQIGLPAWRDAKIKQAVGQIVTAGVTFGIGVVATIASGGATTPTAAENALQVVRVISETAADQSLDAFVEGARDMVKRMEKLAKAAAVIAKAYSLASNVVAAANAINTAGKFVQDLRTASVTSTEASGMIEWEMFERSAVDQLRQPVDNGVQFASELKLAIEALSRHGQAALAARVAAVDAAQGYAGALLQQRLAAAQQQELEASIEQLGKDDAITAAALQRLLQRHIDAKSWLFAALQDYSASYAYWALRPSAVRPHLTQSVDALHRGLGELTAMSLDGAQALTSFRPAPQTLSSKSIVIDDSKVIESLRTKGTAAWSIPLDLPALAGLNRVRLTRVRVWLEGAKAGRGGSVPLLLSTDGSYLDRLGGRTFRFVAQPLRRRFQYRMTPHGGAAADWQFLDGTYGHVEIDGAVDHEVSYAYFEPTPFSQWQLTVDPEAGADLSAVTRVTFELSGSVISN